MKRPNLTRRVAVSGFLWLTSVFVVMSIAKAPLSRAQWQVEVLLIAAVITFVLSLNYLLRNYRYVLKL
ncbi:MAG TPA: hypothetical protein V6C81_03635 [Planktothrix sp.]